MAQCRVTSYYSTRKRVHESKILKQNIKGETVSNISEELKLQEDQVKYEVPVEKALSDKKIKKTTTGPASDSGELKGKNATKKSETKTKKAKPKTTTRTGKGGLKGKPSAGEGSSDIRKVFQAQKEKSLSFKEKDEEGFVIPVKETKKVSEVLSSKPVDAIDSEQKSDQSCKSETVLTKKTKQSKSKTNPRRAKVDLRGKASANKGNSAVRSSEAQEGITVVIKQESDDGISISKRKTVEVLSGKPTDDSKVQLTNKPETVSTTQMRPTEGQKKETNKTSSPTGPVGNVTTVQSVEPSEFCLSSETVSVTPKQNLNSAEEANFLEKKCVTFQDTDVCSRRPQKKQHLEDLNAPDSGSPQKKPRTAQTTNKEDAVVLGTSHRRLDLATKSPTKLDRPTEQGSKFQVTVTNLDRAKFLNSGRLDTLKDRLAKFQKSLTTVKEGEINKCKITSVISAGGQNSSQAVAKQTDIRKSAPAHERFHSLVITGAPSLTLPYKYKWLSEIFRCSDTVVSMLHNRKEICSFLKLKNSVQEMIKRNFTKNHLGQIKTVFPLAYFYAQEKFPSSSFINPKPGVSQYQLVITPNLKTYREESNGKNNENVMPRVENSKANKSLSQNSVNKQSSSVQTSTPNSFLQMNPGMLVERKKIFDSNLLKIVRNHHQDFLARLNPPITVPLEKLTRWHPKFPLDSLPDIQPSSLPEPIDVPKCHTAMDVLNKIKGTVSEKVENALQSVAKKNSSSDAVGKSEVDAKGIIKTGSLKGISSSLLQRIRAREASKIVDEMTMPPEEKKRKQMMERLPEMVRIIRNYFISARKAAISVEDATQKVMDSYHSGLPQEDVKAHIQLLAEVFPKWLSLVTIPKGVFLKIDKNMDINLMLDTIARK